MILDLGNPGDVTGIGGEQENGTELHQEDPLEVGATAGIVAVEGGDVAAVAAIPAVEVETDIRGAGREVTAEVGVEAETGLDIVTGIVTGIVIGIVIEIVTETGIEVEIIGTVTLEGVRATVV